MNDLVKPLAAALMAVFLLVGGCQPVAPGAEQSPAPPAPPATQPAPVPAPVTPAVEPSPAPVPPPVQPAPADTITPPPAAPTPPAPAVPPVPEGAAIGNRAIDFELQTLDGKTVKLSELRGKPVLVNFWATWCGPCKAEMPFLQQINDTYSDKGLVLLAVDLTGSTPTETTEAVQKFLADRNLTMTVPLDQGMKVAKSYLVTAIPSSFLIDSDGIIRQKVIGAFPNVAAIEKELTKIMP